MNSIIENVKSKKCVICKKKLNSSKNNHIKCISENENIKQIKKQKIEVESNNQYILKVDRNPENTTIYI
jgi:hypothetical protein